MFWEFLKRFLLVAPVIFYSGVALAASVAPDQTNETRRAEDYRRLPLAFEANRGQSDSQARFLARGSGYALLLNPSKIILVMNRSRQADPSDPTAASKPPHPTVLELQLVGANEDTQLQDLEPLPGRSHYLTGNRPEKWRTGVPHFARVKYRGVYPGVDLVAYGNQASFEYDFIISPEVDPGIIELRFEGAEKIALSEQGDLLLQLADGLVQQNRPTLYQQTQSGTEPVTGSWVLRGPGRVGFEVGEYDRSRPLTIDPVLRYASFLGGGLDDSGIAVALDSSRNSYYMGVTSSLDFPVLGGVKDTVQPEDIFVTKVSSDGKSLLYSTYLGGTGTDTVSEIGGLAVDDLGSAYLCGITSSSDFPAVNPIHVFNQGGTDAFIVKLTPAGDALEFSGYLGGARVDRARRIALGPDGMACVVGETNSPDFPTIAALQGAMAGDTDAFITCLNAAGDIVFSTYFGGTGYDGAYGVDIDAMGDVYLVGETVSIDFPTKIPLQAANAGGRDLFVTKLDDTGTPLIYSTYLGGTGDDFGRAIDVTPSKQFYVVGSTVSTDFPMVAAFQPALSGGRDAIVASFAPSGSILLYSTYLGGSDDDSGLGIAVDGSGEAHVVGSTFSDDFPTKDPIQAELGGLSDAFLTEVGALGVELLHSTYLGGSAFDVGRGVAVDSLDNVYITGFTGSVDLPISNALQPMIGGRLDAFFARISNIFNFFFAQFGDGDGVSSTLIFSNSSSTEPAEGTARIYDPEGNPLVVDINGEVQEGSFSFNIPPLGTAFFATDGIGDLMVGSAEVTTTTRVGATILFAGGFGVAGVGAVQPLTKFVLPLDLDSANDLNTGVGLSNPQSTATDATLTLLTTAGTPVPNGGAMMTLPAKGQIARFPNEIYANRGIDLSSFKGGLMVEADAPINGMAIRSEPGHFAVLPVTAVD